MFSLFNPTTDGQPSQGKPDYTHIAVILDRTGSMETIRDDTIGGFNAFLNEQKQLPGKATLTLVQFDSQDPYEVIHHVKPIAEVPELTHETYVPRATTPLLDAIGRGINDLEKCLADMKEQDRPSKVVFVVITDGQENASREFRRDQILKMITEKEKQYGWQFVFLSADLNAIDDAIDHGFQTKAAMAFDQSAVGVKNAWASVSQNIAHYRSSKAKDVSFSKEDRQKQRSEGKRKRYLNIFRTGMCVRHYSQKPKYYHGCQDKIGNTSQLRQLLLHTSPFM